MSCSSNDIARVGTTAGYSTNINIKMCVFDDEIFKCFTGWNVNCVMQIPPLLEFTNNPKLLLKTLTVVS